MIPTYTLSQSKPSMWKNESKRGNNDFNPLSVYVLNNPIIWRGNISVVQITMCMESILRRLWAFHISQKAYNVCSSTQVRGSRNRKRRCEYQWMNWKWLMGIDVKKALRNTVVLVHMHWRHAYELKHAHTICYMVVKEISNEILSSQLWNWLFASLSAIIFNLHKSTRMRFHLHATKLFNNRHLLSFYLNYLLMK